MQAEDLDLEEHAPPEQRLCLVKMGQDDCGGRKLVVRECSTRAPEAILPLRLGSNHCLGIEVVPPMITSHLLFMGADIGGGVARLLEAQLDGRGRPTSPQAPFRHQSPTARKVGDCRGSSSSGSSSTAVVSARMASRI